MTTKSSNTKSSRSNALWTAFLVPIGLYALLEWPPLRISGLLSSVNTVSIPKLSNATLTLDNIAERYAQGCPQNGFKTHLYSADPVMIYIENYVSKLEAAYLLEVAEPLYMDSPLSKGATAKTYDKEIRSSMSAVIIDDPVVNCIEKRSLEFQGFLPAANLEDLQVVKYEQSDHFRPHYDWWQGMTNPRISTFFVYLACDSPDETPCDGGATGFPRQTKPISKEWCKFVDCDVDISEEGAHFKPIVGNAVFWRNFYSNYTGHDGVWHAGMPIRKGRKVGLNIFSRRDNMGRG